jgi:division protein CdvB (Snf7/Vps24/ESCRT-III family)
VEIILGTISSLRLLGGSKDGEYKGKIVTALKDIEIQRRELEGLRGRLSQRRQTLFDSTVRALQEKNKAKANVYANEHAEVRKTMKVVEASELALTQVTLRLQSIMEIGDAMSHMTTAFKSLKVVSKTMEGFVPALDATSESINNTLSETMAQMGQLSPGIRVDIHNENAEELVEQARKFAEEQAEKLKHSLRVMPSRFEADVNLVEDRIPILATGDDYEEESPILGTIFSTVADPKVENDVLRYATAHNGVIDVSETSANLGIPQDEVEQSMIRLVAQGKVKSQRSESSR